MMEPTTLEKQPGVTAPPTPEKIMQISTGFWPAKILLSAVHYDLFTKLANGAQSCLEIKKQLGWNCADRHAYDYLDALSSLGFLVREGIWETAKYSNGPEADFYLDKNKPSYMGGMLDMANNRLYTIWGRLEEGLKTGEPQNELKDGSGDLFKSLYSDPAKLAEFIHAMSGIQMGNFIAFAQKFDFSGAKTLNDIGGSGALLSLMVAKHNQHMNCTSYDLPPVAPIANGIIAGFGLQDRVKTGNVDFFNDELPSADILVMGNILHDWDEPTKLMLMKKAYDALPEGGRFVAIEGVIDENRKENLFGLMASLNMLLETGTGFDYTYGDYRKWAAQVGFKKTDLMPLAGPFSAAIAYK
jgi:hypothetical protein